jgi:CO/xanthine dehydrogenase FAD-binding subunit
MDYFRPRQLDEALRDLAQRNPRVLSGGTDVFPSLQNQPLTGPVLDVTAISALRGISQTERGWRLGAGSTWTDVAQASLPPAFAALQQAALEVGAVQVQNRGTIAGNLCNASPAADGVPPLLVLDAEVELSSVTATRLLPLDQFIFGNRKTARRSDELLTAIHIPARSISGKSQFQKLGTRHSLVISIAMVAARLEMRGAVIADCAIAVGACSPVARRLRRLEQALVGQHLSDVSIGSEALDGLAPIDDVRATAAYRTSAVAELVARALAGAAT